MIKSSTEMVLKEYIAPYCMLLSLPASSICSVSPDNGENENVYEYDLYD